MGVFDTTVQKLKYDVLTALIRDAYEHNIDNIYTDIPKAISPGPKATMRCCVYKERAILQERIKLALGGDKSNPNVVEVIGIACDECPMGGVFVTPSCRGCLVHSCREVCPKNAIVMVDKKAVIDKSKCIECGKCAKACPYSAIIEAHRPCVTSCKVGAISMDECNTATIDNDKCIRCGACVYQCPFGAISDKSMVTDVIGILKKSEAGGGYKVYAVVAPSIVSQFKYAKLEQIVTGIKRLGFCEVVEAALGADVCVTRELDEWSEKKKLTTSCCPAFVMFVEKNFPELRRYISDSVSPMIETARLIKAADCTAKVIFIGPCTAKKEEYKLEKTGGAVDGVLSFEELQAFLDARRIDYEELPETPLDNASYYGRIFAKSGGIAQGIASGAAKKGIEGLKPVALSGIDECKAALLRLKCDKSADNFFEGMACEGGCINGALCLSHRAKSLADVDRYADAAKGKDVAETAEQFKKAHEKT